MMGRGFARYFVMLMMLAMTAFNAHADADAPPQVLVRAHLEPSGSVVAGTQVKLVVDCLTTTWFTDAPDWPLPNVPDAFVTLPDENAQNLDETIDGVKWFGVSRAYRITPRAGKRYVIAPFAITLHPGGTDTPVQAKTPALELVATLPPGAQDMTVFFPAPQLSVSQTITPRGTRVKVGDVVTRTITQRAAGTESMLIPPIAPVDVAGLKRYGTQAATKNIVDDRQGLVAGERTDTVSYVVERAGAVRLPEISVEWWNTKTQRKETLVLPAVKISAEAAHEKPLFAIPADPLGKGAAHRVIYLDGARIGWGIACVLAVLLAVWAWPWLAARWRAARRAVHVAVERYRGGEHPAWRALLHAARRGTQAQTVAALYRWLDRRRDVAHPARVDALRERCDDAASAQVIDAIDQTYAAPADARIGTQPLRALRRALRRTQRIALEKARSHLPPLNLD